ncbi:hypothetical protein KCP73_05900 [Salmonella enterica subsp. enterica]|nr:hypothetical protein KCP73_05900 [Salmonella enterica subsp. enterica]
MIRLRSAKSCWARLRSFPAAFRLNTYTVVYHAARDGNAIFGLFLVIYSGCSPSADCFRLLPHGAFWRRRHCPVKDYPPRESHRRRRGQGGFRNDGGDLVGIPVGNLLTEPEFSWRYTFLLIAAFNIAVLTAISSWVPDIS